MKLNRTLPWCLSLVLAVPLVALIGTAAQAATDYQAEDATISQGAVATNHTGYTGTGFVDYTNITGSYVEFTVSAATAGTSSLALRYANGTTVDRPMDLSVNGTVVASGVSFPATADWNAWATKSCERPARRELPRQIRATATTANGGPNLDRVGVGTAAAGALAAGPAELLGHRRGRPDPFLGCLHGQRRRVRVRPLRARQQARRGGR